MRLLSVNAVFDIEGHIKTSHLTVTDANRSLRRSFWEPGRITSGPLWCFSVSSSCVSLFVWLKTNNLTRLVISGTRVEPRGARPPMLLLWQGNNRNTGG